MQHLAQLSSSQADMSEDINIISDHIKVVMEMLQHVCVVFWRPTPLSSMTGSDRHKPKQQSLLTALHQLSKRSGGSFPDLLPELILNRGEVDRIGKYAVCRTLTADIWEGAYLRNEKVAICALGALNCDQRTLQVRQQHDRRNSILGLISF